jgi:hypothetical protein
MLVHTLKEKELSKKDMGSFKDLTGQIFGDLSVIKFEGKDKLGKTIWLCRCKCGNLTKIRGDCLTTGNSKTCGNCPVNQYNIIDDIAIGITSNGQTFIFDADDFITVKKYTWGISTGGYVTANLKNGDLITLHSLIMGEVRGLWIDHISRNKLDNRRRNLRYVTPQQNSYNCGISKNNSTGYKGVYFDKARGKYQAEITCSRQKYHLGRFNSAVEAAKAYNQKAIELFGEYAFLNSI